MMFPVELKNNYIEWSSESQYVQKEKAKAKRQKDTIITLVYTIIVAQYILNELWKNVFNVIVYLKDRNLLLDS